MVRPWGAARLQSSATDGIAAADPGENSAVDGTFKRRENRPLRAVPLCLRLCAYAAAGRSAAGISFSAAVPPWTKLPAFFGFSWQRNQFPR